MFKEYTYKMKTEILLEVYCRDKGITIQKTRTEHNLTDYLHFNSYFKINHTKLIIYLPEWLILIKRHFLL